MNKFILIIKSFIPPIIVSILRKLKNKPLEQATSNVWSGDYLSWAEAKKNSIGYQSDLILQKCIDAMLKVKNGEAVYERDSVLFDKIEYSWGLLAGLQKAAIDFDNELCVLDFGGSLGSSYFQNKKFLNNLKSIEWCVVEQENFVAAGKQNFEDKHLKFYNTIEEVVSKHKPNVLLLGSVLQYLEKPYDWIEKFNKLNIPYIIIDRTAFAEGANDILTVQTVPGTIYNASYPAWFFGTEFFSLLKKDYELIATHSSSSIPSIIINQKNKVNWNGLIFKKK